jgi:sarcosine oxidase
VSERADVVVVGLGALGSATAWQLARRGLSVVGLERFDLGHSRGASHDTSRILRHSYHTPAYVRLTQEAYADWADLENTSGQDLVTVVGGLDLFPPEPAISPADYLDSLSAVGIDHEVMGPDEVRERWPQIRLPDGTLVLHQRGAAIVPAGRGTALMQDLARRAGAELRGQSPVRVVRARDAGVELETPDGRVSAGALVVCADAWTNDVLASFGRRLPLEVTLEQVTYFAPADPSPFRPGRLPLWIWMDDPCFYGFPTYGEDTVKAAHDCGGPVVDPESRTSEPDAAMRHELAAHMARLLPGSGPPIRSVRCQYTLTPDRDFVMAPLPEAPQVVVGLGAAHGFKFAPTFGRVLADLVTDGTTGSDVSAFGLDRPGLTDPSYRAHWLV